MELINLSKKFDKVLFKDLSLKLEGGKLYLLKGISGCGKTTLLNIIANLDSEYEGECLFDGKDLKNMKKNEKKNYRQKVGYINQQSLLIGDMNVYDNLRFVCDDKEYIQELAGKFGVSELLDKMPSQMSGGERQRISIIRALLKRPDILIADEPTASLGGEHSEIIVEAFEVIKGLGVITVVSTHEEVFDNVADVIINMDTDGTYEVVDLNTQGHDGTEPVEVNKKIMPEKGRKNIKYCFNQLKKTKNVVMIVILILMQIVLLVSIGVSTNYRREFVKEVSEKYKTYILQVMDYEYDNLVKKYGNDKVEKLDFYCYKEEKFDVYSMLDEDDSGFAIDGSLEYGTFPKNEKEVLVDAVYADNDAGNKNHESEIGKSVMISGKEYTISGVIIGDDDISNTKAYNEAYGGIVPYKATRERPCVFVMESVIKDIGEKYEGYEFNVRFKDFYMYDELLDYIMVHGLNRERLFTMPSADRITDGLYQVEIVNKIIIVILIAIFITMIIFVQNQINMAMFYRKEEFGYLQLFGIETSRIKKLVIIENVIKAIISIVTADVIYMFVIGIVNVYLGMNLMCNSGIIALVGLAVILYFVISSWIPIRKMLKKDIIKLIR